MKEEYIRDIYRERGGRYYLKHMIIPLSNNPYKEYGKEVRELEDTYYRNVNEIGKLEFQYMRSMIREWVEYNTTYSFKEDIPVFELFEKYMEAIKENDIFKRDEKRAYLFFIRYIGIWRGIGNKTIFMNDKKRTVAVINNYAYTHPFKNITECEYKEKELREEINDMRRRRIKC